MDHSGKEDQGIHILFLQYDRELSVMKQERQRPDTPISDSATQSFGMTQMSPLTFEFLDISKEIHPNLVNDLFFIISNQSDFIFLNINYSIQLSLTPSA